MRKLTAAGSMVYVALPERQLEFGMRSDEVVTKGCSTSNHAIAIVCLSVAVKVFQCE
ncbi:hypothetical protein [Escherichia coli]|uniref:hypothetical protein n=1 Tax=Escherichia coli TaxID=562 RepID=UPI00387E80E7